MIRNHSLKNCFKGLSVFLLFMFYESFALLPFNLLKIDYNSLNMTYKACYNLFSELVLMIVIFLILKDFFIEPFKDFKKNNQKYFNKYIKYWFIALGGMMLSNLVITLIAPGSVANNQEAVIDTLHKAPIYTFIASVFLAPLLEESVFRLGFRLIFKNDLFFILISGLIFGSLHVLPMATNIIDYLYIIPYSLPGIVFAYTLTKSDNIFVPMSLHFIHNGLLMSLQFFILLFGV